MHWGITQRVGVVVVTGKTFCKMMKYSKYTYVFYGTYRIVYIVSALEWPYLILLDACGTNDTDTTAKSLIAFCPWFAFRQISNTSKWINIYHLYTGVNTILVLYYDKTLCGIAHTAPIKTFWMLVSIESKIPHTLSSHAIHGLYYRSTLNGSHYGLNYEPLTRYVKLRVVHAQWMPGTFSPPPTWNETTN